MNIDAYGQILESFPERWFTELVHVDLPRTNPGRIALVAVAAIMASRARISLDATVDFLPLDQITADAGISKRTVRLVIRWLVDNDWLIVTAKASGHSPARYRLTFPEGVPVSLPIP